MFATACAILNYSIAPEKRIIEKSGQVTINIYLSKKTPFLHFISKLVSTLVLQIASKQYNQQLLLVESKFIPCYAVKMIQN